jgi:hypothetical protein
VTTTCDACLRADHLRCRDENCSCCGVHTAVSIDAPDPAGYRSAQVCRATGVSYRMLDYWCRIGLVHPSISQPVGSGTVRRWSAEDVRRVRVAAAVMAQTHSTDVAAAALRSFSGESSGRWLVYSDGSATIVDEGHLEEVLAGAGGGTVVDLRPDHDWVHDHRAGQTA